MSDFYRLFGEKLKLPRIVCHNLGLYFVLDDEGT